MKRLIILAFLLCAVSVQAQTVLLTEDMMFPVGSDTTSYSFEKPGKAKIFGRENGSGFWILNPYARVGVNFNARLAGNARNECFQRDRLLLVGNDSLMLSKDKIDQNFIVIIGESVSIDLWFPDACVSYNNEGNFAGSTNIIFTDFYVVALDSLPPEEPPVDPLAMTIEEISHWELTFRMLAGSVDMTGVDTLSVENNVYKMKINQRLSRTKVVHVPITYPLHPSRIIKDFSVFNPPDSLFHLPDSSVNVMASTEGNFQIGNWGVGIRCVDINFVPSAESDWFRFVVKSDDPVNAPMVPVIIYIEAEGQN